MLTISNPIYTGSKLLCIFYCRTPPILKTLRQFENLVFVIMSTRENMRLSARTPLENHDDSEYFGILNLGIML